MRNSTNAAGTSVVRSGKIELEKEENKNERVRVKQRVFVLLPITNLMLMN